MRLKKDGCGGTYIKAVAGMFTSKNLGGADDFKKVGAGGRDFISFLIIFCIENHERSRLISSMLKWLSTNVMVVS